MLLAILLSVQCCIYFCATIIFWLNYITCRNGQESVVESVSILLVHVFYEFCYFMYSHCMDFSIFVHEEDCSVNFPHKIHTITVQ